MRVYYLTRKVKKQFSCRMKAKRRHIFLNFITFIKADLYPSPPQPTNLYVLIAALNPHKVLCSGFPFMIALMDLLIRVYI